MTQLVALDSHGGVGVEVVEKVREVVALDSHGGGVVVTELVASDNHGGGEVEEVAVVMVMVTVVAVDGYCSVLVDDGDGGGGGDEVAVVSLQGYMGQVAVVVEENMAEVVKVVEESSRGNSSLLWGIRTNVPYDSLSLSLSRSKCYTTDG